jgi:hypothetical protein
MYLYAYLGASERSLLSLYRWISKKFTVRLDCPRLDMGNSSTRTQKNCKGLQVHELELELFLSQYLPIAKMLEFQLPQEKLLCVVTRARSISILFCHSLPFFFLLSKLA